MTGLAELSAAQRAQRADARNKAVVSRKRRMMRRLYNELRSVQQVLSDMGVEVDLEGNIVPDGRTVSAGTPSARGGAAASAGSVEEEAPTIHEDASASGADTGSPRKALFLQRYRVHPGAKARSGKELVAAVALGFVGDIPGVRASNAWLRKRFSDDIESGDVEETRPKNKVSFKGFESHPASPLAARDA